eukprot:gene9248-1518_t
MSRLAHVQVNSHGHPMTSGIPSTIMNYFVSWAAAELPEAAASKHYTEKLVLLPAHTMHQYYEHRVTNGKSNQDGMKFNHMTRGDFPSIPSDGNWYMCMQKPFKRHPEMDHMIAGVLRGDPAARIILHEPIDSAYNQRLVKERLERTGADVSRAYYNIIGVHDLVARNKQEYVDIAVKLGTDPVARAAVEQKIKDNVHKLFFKEEAVAAWTKLCDNPGGKGFVSVGSKLSNVGAAGAAGRAATPTHSYNEESEWDVSGANAVDPASLFGARDEL